VVGFLADGCWWLVVAVVAVVGSRWLAIGCCFWWLVVGGWHFVVDEASNGQFKPLSPGGELDLIDTLFF